jgi:hypothetical protein
LLETLKDVNVWLLSFLILSVEMKLYLLYSLIVNQNTHHNRFTDAADEADSRATQIGEQSRT